MSKMGMELDKRLEENKYEMYEALKEVRDFIQYMPCIIECTCGDKQNQVSGISEVLSKIEGGKTTKHNVAQTTTLWKY